MDIDIGRPEDIIKIHHKNFHSGSSGDIISMSDKDVEKTSFGLGLHDIGKNSHCDILFFCNIYCDMKNNNNNKKKNLPDDFNLYL